MKPLLICCGAAALDTIFRMEEIPSGPGKVLPLDAVQVAEGMASSAAAAIAKLGGRPMLFARVGADQAGVEIRRSLTEAGIDCRFVRAIEGARSPVATVLVDRHGERLVIPFYDAALGSDAAWLPLDEIAGAAAVLVDVRWPQGAAQVLDKARQSSIPAVLDLDTGPLHDLLTLLPLASHVVASHPAAHSVTGEADPIGATAALAGMHPGFVAVTAGAQGCYWFNRAAGMVRHVPAPQVEVVDTLASGDVFHGAFALALAQARPIEDCLRFAAVAAALKCRIFGGRLGIPTLAEVEQWLAR
jgi:sulfofructose kinase